MDIGTVLIKHALEEEHEAPEAEIKQELTPEQQLEENKWRYSYISKVLDAAKFRVERYEMLMGRKKAQKWNDEKKKRNVRRYMTAAQTSKEAEEILPLLKANIEELEQKTDG